MHFSISLIFGSVVEFSEEKDLLFLKEVGRKMERNGNDEKICSPDDIFFLHPGISFLPSRYLT